MGRMHSPTDYAWLLLKKRTGQGKLTDFYPNLIPEKEDVKSDFKHLLEKDKQGIFRLPDKMFDTAYNNLKIHDDLLLMHERYLHEHGLDDWEFSFRNFLRSAFLHNDDEYFAASDEPDYLDGADSIEQYGLLSSDAHDLAEEVRNIVTGGQKSHQTKLGRFHPQLPNPYDKAWVEHDPEHSPELTEEIERDRKNIAASIRVTPEKTGSIGRYAINPETGKRERLPTSKKIRPKLLTEGHPLLEPEPGNIGFEGFDRFRKPKRRQFPIATKPGFFETVPVARDISNISVGHSFGEKPNWVGVRGNLKDDPAWIREPEETSERLHEIYRLTPHEPDKIFELFSLIPGRSEAQKMIDEHGLGRNEFRYSNWMKDVPEKGLRHIANKYNRAKDITSFNSVQAQMRRLSDMAIPSLSAGLDREGKPMTIPSEKIEEFLLHGLGQTFHGFEEPFGDEDTIDEQHHVDEILDRMQTPRKGHSTYGESESNVIENENIDLLDALHIPSLYALTHASPGNDRRPIADKDLIHYQAKILEYLSKEHDIPFNVLWSHLGNKVGGVLLHGHEVASQRFMYNTSKAAGIDFHATTSVPYPKDEHGFPLTTEGKQLSGNAISMLYGDKNTTGYNSRMKRFQGQVGDSGLRYSQLPAQGEEMVMQPPTTEEIEAMKGIEPEQRDGTLWSKYSQYSEDKGPTQPMIDALNQLRGTNQEWFGGARVE